MKKATMKKTAKKVLKAAARAMDEVVKHTNKVSLNKVMVGVTLLSAIGTAASVGGSDPKATVMYAVGTAALLGKTIYDALAPTRQPRQTTTQNCKLTR